MLSSPYHCPECRSSNSTKLKPHCLCALIQVSATGGQINPCNWRCPTESNCSKGDGNEHKSHCPTCLGRMPGISHHSKYSSVIDLYFCSSCEDFHRRWSEKSAEDNWSAWGNFKCAKNGECFSDWECKSTINCFIFN